MPITMPPSLRILRRHVEPNQANVEYLVQFAIEMQDSDPRTPQYIGAPGMPYSSGTVYEIDLHTILSPIAAQIPNIRSLQFTATMFYTSASPNIKEFYIFNPTTSQVVTVLMLPALGTSPSVVNAAVPFTMDSAAQLNVFWRTGANPTVLTETVINLSAVLLTYDVSSYWSQTTDAIALSSGAVVPHAELADFKTIKGGNMQQDELLLLV